jgi:hypothetical protein
MLGLISSGVVVHHVQAQGWDINPWEGEAYEPLARAELWATMNGHSDTSETQGPTNEAVWHRVRGAAVYAGEGTKPSAGAAAYESISNYYGWPEHFEANAWADLYWPFQVFDRNTGSFLNRPGSLSIPMKVDYHIHVSVKAETTEEPFAEGSFSIGSVAANGSVAAYRRAWWDLGEKTEGSVLPHGTLTFDYTGPPWLPLSVEIETSARVSIDLPGGLVLTSWAECEAEAVVDPYLYIDPASPLADELEVRTLKSIDAPEDDPSSWVLAVDTPIDFIPTTATVDTNPRTVNEVGSETTKISGNLASNGTGLEGKTMKLYYQNASAEYETPSGNWTHIANVITGSGGHYEYDWNPEDGLTTGNYSIRAVFDGDVDYLPGSATTGVDAIPNLVIVPEMPLETIAVLATMTLTFAEIVVLRKKRKIKLHVS